MANSPELSRRGLVAAAVLAAVPFAALGYATAAGDLSTLATVHVWTATVWTGAVIAVGFGLAPTLRERSVDGTVSLVARTAPLAVTVLPSMALVTVAGGLRLGAAYGLFSPVDSLTWAVLGATGAVLVVAFGLALPRDLRVCRELAAADTDRERVARLSTRTATLLTVQGSFQLALLFLMSRVAEQAG